MSGAPEARPDRLQDDLLALLLREQGFAPGEAHTIRPRARGADAPLSSQQKRLWFLHQLDRANSSYVIPGAVRVTGPLDVAVLQRALDQLVARHESLRTVFAERDGRPVQVILDAAPADLEVEPIDREAASDLEAALRDRAIEALAAPFDLARGPLVRARVLTVSPANHLVVLAMHHIVSDGWSMAVFIRELVALYDADAAGGAASLPPPALQYADFAVWQDEWRASEAAAGALAFWKRQLAGLPRLELPTDRPRPSVLTYAGATVQTTLDEPTTAAVRAFDQRTGATLFMTMASAFAALLHRYSGQTDLPVGTPSANRNRAELEGLIGFFVNALVLRADLSGEPSFRTLVERMKQVSLDAWAHQDVPFEDIVEALQPERTPSRNPLFQVMFVLQNAPEGRLDVSGLTFEPVDLPTTTAKFDLSLYVVETGATLSVLLEYNRDLFDRDTAGRMLAHYGRLLAAAVAEPDRPVADLPMIPAGERARVTVGWNDTTTAYPRQATIHELFRDQAARTPDAVAAVLGPARITYGELERRANQLARRLAASGAADGIVGLLVERSLEMLVGMLGILKAGAAYLPLDPAWPRDRLAFLLHDARAGLVVSQPPFAASLPGDVAVVEIDASWASIASEPDSPPACAVHPLDLAYVVFTSGSTGVPKGVAVPHRAVVRLVRETGYARFAPDEVFLQFAPLAFDASTFEIWGALLNGATLAVCPPGAASLAELGREMAAARVTTAWLTAGLFHQMVDHEIDALRGLKTLVAGGDVLSPSHVRRLLDAAPGLTMVNGFGPTETTTFACCHAMRTASAPIGGTVPIGPPIANTRVYVLDARLEPAPIGVPGELYIGGDGVARGYLHRPDVTAERFVPDPFSPEPGGRLYRTGDLARWLPSGVVEFLGRRDFQVKVRGFRIEPGEIEAALVAHPAVRDAVVVVRSEASDRHLVAYVAAGAGATSPDELRAFLQARLPDYMIPSAIVQLDALPLTANGKVDRAALPAPDRTGPAAAAFVAPVTADEVAIARIWCEVLHTDRVGLHDNFFELGGHSLVATQVVARLREAFGVEIPLRALFVEPTVAALARELERARALGAAPAGAIQSVSRSAARLAPGGRPRASSAAKDPS